MSELRDRRELRAVLRYWLAALRHEESLASRPRAQRPTSESGRGQAYVKVGAEHAAFFAEASGDVLIRADAAAHRFLEHWIRASDRQSSGDHAETDWIAGWPAVFFARREEVGTLFRFPVSLEWRKEAKPWETPPRRRGEYGLRDTRRLAYGTGAPDTLLVRALEPTEEGLPGPGASVDREIMNSVLGVSEEELADLERGWGESCRPSKMVRDVLGVLGVKDPPRNGAELFAAVLEAMRPRLPPGVSVWPTGIVQDGALVHATYHLKQELEDLLAAHDREAPLIEGTALWSYLSGRPGRPGRVPLRARFRPRGLTASQRSAGELFLGSTLAAVQGPPGTGKTELILSLAAQALVDRIDRLADERTMGTDVLVVASTNNRAVDNVTDPLGEGLALALRTGNQEVTATATAAAFGRAKAWLEGQEEAGALERLQVALTAFRRARGELAAAMRPELEREKRRARLEALRAEVEELRGGGKSASKLDAALETIAGGMERLQRIVEARGKKKKLSRLEARWAEMVAELPALGDPASPLARALQLPPELDEDADETESLEAWEDAIEAAADVVSAALRKAPDSGQKKARAKRLREVERELEEVEASPEPLPIDTLARARIESLAHALFLAAVDVRERWAVANRADLISALEKAGEAAVKLRSLRRFLAKEPAVRASLARLYPVFGSTLLSLGNVFPGAPNVIDRLVIDEAGQCHPAYAVSGLLRAKSALLIGDVHQLLPVSRLSEREEARVVARAGVAREFGEGLERLAPFRVHERTTTSAQALADRAVEVRPVLTDHFRCRAEIIAISDALAGYGLEVHTEPREETAASVRLGRPVLFAEIRGRQIRARGSWANEDEAFALVELLEELRGAGVAWSELAVITPFVGQAELLRGYARRRGIPLDGHGDDRPALFDETGNYLALGTVHRFQGGERSIVLFSTVVTEARSLPFLDDRANLLNVAVSRAKEHLVVFGHEVTLLAGRHTRLLVERAERFYKNG